MGRKQASVELTYEQKENFHANFRYMWDKLGTSYYYILGPDSMDDFNERRNGVNDELGLLPSYTICSKCYTGKDDFWPGRNTIRKVVNFYNRWITPEISVAEILSTRLVDSDYARFRIGSEMDPRFIGVYYGYYWSQHMKQMTGAYLILTPGGTMENTRMRAHLITGFRTDQDMHEQNLLNNVLSTNKISYTTYYEWFTGLPTQKQQTNYYEGEAEMSSKAIVIRLSGADRDFRRLTVILNTRAFAQVDKFNRSSEGGLAFVLSSGTEAAPPHFFRMGFIRRDSDYLSLETKELGEMLQNDKTGAVLELTNGLDSRWIETVWKLKSEKKNDPRG